MKATDNQQPQREASGWQVKAVSIYSEPTGFLDAIIQEQGYSIRFEFQLPDISKFVYGRKFKHKP